MTDSSFMSKQQPEIFDTNFIIKYDKLHISVMWWDAFEQWPAAVWDLATVCLQ